ncbi:DNA-binding protein D-ETS-4 [Gryllus bimaculatus]|nr:DNA-binding protein D-ETS-4 [Gryllus bimaculatus]
MPARASRGVYSPLEPQEAGAPVLLFFIRHTHRGYGNTPDLHSLPEHPAVSPLADFLLYDVGTGLSLTTAARGGPQAHFSSFYAYFNCRNVLPALQKRQPRPPPPVLLAMAVLELLEQGAAPPTSAAAACSRRPLRAQALSPRSPPGAASLASAPRRARRRGPRAPQPRLLHVVQRPPPRRRPAPPPAPHPPGHAPAAAAASAQPCKRKRGRPAKAPSKLDAGRVERVMLWRFLLNLLEEPRAAPAPAPCIHWVRREEGLFRITNTEWLARLWGRRHGNPLMTYEKMARAMRRKLSSLDIDVQFFFLELIPPSLQYVLRFAHCAVHKLELLSQHGSMTLHYTISLVESNGKLPHSSPDTKRGQVEPLAHDPEWIKNGSHQHHHHHHHHHHQDNTLETCGDVGVTTKMKRV